MSTSASGHFAGFGSPEFTDKEYTQTLPNCPVHDKPDCKCGYLITDSGFVFSNMTHGIMMHNREVRQHVSDDGIGERLPQEQHVYIPDHLIPSLMNALKVFIKVRLEKDPDDINSESGLMFLVDEKDTKNSDD